MVTLLLDMGADIEAVNEVSQVAIVPSYRGGGSMCGDYSEQWAVSSEWSSYCDKNSFTYNSSAKESEIDSGSSDCIVTDGWCL